MFEFTFNVTYFHRLLDILVYAFAFSVLIFNKDCDVFEENGIGSSVSDPSVFIKGFRVKWILYDDLGVVICSDLGVVIEDFRRHPH